ncbi:MAG: MlrC C-terminal domain-containing protein, partial [Bythopirellula sp.]
AVTAACEAGPGAMISVQIGGRSGPLNGDPLEDRFTVVSLHDGRFTEKKPLHGGFDSFDQGRTAVLTTNTGLTVIVTSKRMTPFSLGQISSCNLDPATFHILVAKGVNAPIVAYQQICNSFVRVGTPGYTSADLTSLEYFYRRRPMFPFEPDVRWSAGDANGV